MKPVKTERPIWWDSSLCGNLDEYGPTTRMLITHATSTVYTGTCRGILEDQEGKRGIGKFLKALCKKVRASIAFTSGPLFGRGAHETWLVWAHGSIVVKIGTDSKISVNLSTTNALDYQAIGVILGEYILSENVRQPVYSLATGAKGIEIAEVGLAGKDWESENYSEEVVDDFYFAVAELQREDPIGRLLLLDGSPGTGKTYFIRGLIHEVLDAIFVLVPSHMVEDLAGPELVPMLIRARSLAGSDKPIVLLIEDADKALVPREDQKGSLTAISALLNVSDGILGSALNLRIVCTTNAKIDEIDSALKRPGRLSRQIHIGLLSAEKAAEIYFRITGTEGVQFDGPLSLAEVYRFAKVEEVADSEDETDDDDDDEDDEDDDDDDDEGFEQLV
jgi:hypothetical protein